MKSIVNQLGSVPTSFFLQQQNFQSFEEEFLTFKSLLIILEFNQNEAKNVIACLEKIIEYCESSAHKDTLIHGLSRLKEIKIQDNQTMLSLGAEQYVSFEQRIQKLEQTVKEAKKEAIEAKKNAFYALCAAAFLVVLRLLHK